jgi:hypothetical protein
MKTLFIINMILKLVDVISTGYFVHIFGKEIEFNFIVDYMIKNIGNVPAMILDLFIFVSDHN